MPGFANDASTPPQSIMWADNVDFSGNVIPSGQFTTDGQLLIGSTVAPNIRSSTLTAGTGITITNGAGTITVGVSGSVVGLTITGNTGGARAPVGGNWDIKTAGATAIFAGTSGAETLNFAIQNLLLGSSGSITTGSGNVSLGLGALDATTTGGSNTAIGLSALQSNVGGASNTAIGNASMILFNAGVGPTFTRNTAIGNNSLNALVTGTDNIALGNLAGHNYASSESSNIVIGNQGTVAESNVIRIGTSGSGTGQQNKCFIVGIDGVNVGSVAKVLTMASDQLGTATITAGTGITVTPTANAITISASSSGFSWTDVTGATQTIAAENGYLTDRGGGVTYTLPVSASIGDTFKIVGKAGLATITPLALQQLLIGSASGTVGITGTAVSTNLGDCITFVCTTSGSSTIWRAETVVGTWTLN